MVAIKYMEMPKGCVDCELENIPNCHCGVGGHWVCDYEDKRPSDCPLIEIEQSEDKVTITFASYEADSAYASGSVHLDMGEQDPNIKFIRNLYGKEIRFTKDSLTITNNSGTEIVLSDQEGLIFTSAGNIVLEAEKEISISSSSDRVTLQGETGVELSQGDSKVIVNGDVKLVGQQIHIQNLE